MTLFTFENTAVLQVKYMSEDLDITINLKDVMPSSHQVSSVVTAVRTAYNVPREVCAIHTFLLLHPIERLKVPRRLFPLLRTLISLRIDLQGAKLCSKAWIGLDHLNKNSKRHQSRTGYTEKAIKIHN